MKTTLLLIISLLMAGVFLMKKEAPEENLKPEVKMETQESKPTEVVDLQKMRKKRLPSYEELDTKYQKLSRDEVEELLSKLEADEKNKNLINQANSNSLTPSEEADLLLYIRSRIVLTTLLAEDELRRIDL